MSGHLDRLVVEALDRDIHQACTSECQAFTILVAGRPVTFCARSDSSLIQVLRGAFIPSNEEPLNSERRWRLHVALFEESSIHQDLGRAILRGLMVNDSFTEIDRYRLHVEQASGVITLIDTENSLIVVALRRLSELDPRAAITPFRIALAHIVDAEGGVLLHSALVQSSIRTVAIAGRSGTGKSSLSQALAETGWSVLSDDAFAYVHGRAFPIYRRAKWSFSDGRKGHHLGVGKSFIELDGLEGAANAGARVSCVVLPHISSRVALHSCSPDVTARRIVESSLPEIAGGTQTSRYRIRKFSWSVPGLIMALGPRNDANARFLTDALVS